MSTAATRTPTPAARKLLPRDQRRAAILAAAATAFAKTGFASTSMSDVADEAGVTRILLYRHFSSKEELYRAVLEQVVAALEQNYEPRDVGSAGEAAMRAHLGAARSNPDGYRLLWEHAKREPDFRDMANDVRTVVEAMAEDLVGPFIAPQLRGWAAHVTVQYLVEAVLAWLDHGTTDDELLVATATAGLRSLVVGWAEAGGPSRS